MKRCSQCRELVQNEALVCRYCHHRFSDEENTHASRNRREGKVLGVILLVVVFIAAANWLNSEEGMSGLVNFAVAAE